MFWASVIFSIFCSWAGQTSFYFPTTLSSGVLVRLFKHSIYFQVLILVIRKYIFISSCSTKTLAMRLSILVSLLALSSIVSAQLITKNTFRLTGKVVGQDTGYVHLNYLNSSKKFIQDSFYLRKGEFEFSGSITEPCHAFFYGNIKSRSVDDLNFT